MICRSSSLNIGAGMVDVGGWVEDDPVAGSSSSSANSSAVVVDASLLFDVDDSASFDAASDSAATCASRCCFTTWIIVSAWASASFSFCTSSGRLFASSFRFWMGSTRPRSSSNLALRVSRLASAPSPYSHMLASLDFVSISSRCTCVDAETKPSSSRMSLILYVYPSRLFSVSSRYTRVRSDLSKAFNRFFIVSSPSIFVLHESC